jgi:ectoine hydroxylase-related dioxygenase (phytanoyl-CoA dioxygenase family)
MLEVTISEEERRGGHLTPGNLRDARRLLRLGGYVVLRDAFPRDLVRATAGEFADILRDCIASREGDGWYQVSNRSQAVFWERGARWRIFPKLRPPLNDVLLLANPLITPLLAELLGPDFTCKFVSSDTCVKGSEPQAPHRELGTGGAREPRAYVVNVPLTRCTRRNGPLEVWPNGTHLWDPDLLDRHGLSDEVQDGSNPELERFARSLPSELLLLEPGNVLIRDPGMLHRGTPNRTRKPRTMLTICYLSRSHDYDYGSIDYNLDNELFRELDPRVQRLFPELTGDHQPRPVSRNRAAPSRQPLA